MNIFFGIADTGACGTLRMIQPALCLREMGHHVEISDRETPFMYDQADIVVFQRATNKAMIDIIRKLHGLGKKVVYEIDDDLWHLPYYNQHSGKGEMRTKGPSYDFELLKTMQSIITNCDAVTVSTAPLGDVLRQWHDRIAVLPNCVAFEDWMLPDNEGQDGPVRIGWSGGYEHPADLDLVVGALLQIKKEYGERVQLAFMMGSCFPKELIGVAEHYPHVPYQQFMASLQELRLDIGLLPLVDNAFNRSKSNLKFLDYSALGMASIASPVFPYVEDILDGVNGLIVKKNRHSEWVRQIRRLIDNTELRKTLAENASQYVRAGYDMQANAWRWEEFYAGLLRGR